MVITHKFYEGSVPAEAGIIRQTIFINEQGFSYEFDDIDNISTHILLFCDGIPAATGRLFKDNTGEWHIGRIAVKKEYRGMKFGAEVMKRLEEKAKEKSAKKLILSAQCRARKFYEKCGYTAYGDVYLDEFCEHIGMMKNI